VQPKVEEEVKFLLGGENWKVGVVNLAVLACVLRTTTKKVINFLTKKVHLRENPGCVYVYYANRV